MLQDEFRQYRLSLLQTLTMLGFNRMGHWLTMLYRHDDV